MHIHTHMYTCIHLDTHTSMHIHTLGHIHAHNTHTHAHSHTQYTPHTHAHDIHSHTQAYTHTLSHFSTQNILIDTHSHTNPHSGTHTFIPTHLHTCAHTHFLRRAALGPWEQSGFGVEAGCCPNSVGGPAPLPRCHDPPWLNHSFLVLTEGHLRAGHCLGRRHGGERGRGGPISISPC